MSVEAGQVWVGRDERLTVIGVEGDNILCFDTYRGTRPRLTLRDFRRLRLDPETPPEDGPIRVGDLVECRHDEVWQAARQASDIEKANRRGSTWHLGNAAAYMHIDEAYLVLGVERNGGIRLRGFVSLVSPNDLRRSNKPTYR